MRLARTLALAVFLAIAGTHGYGLARPQSASDAANGYQRELDARALLGRAEELGARGQYADAQRTYRKLAEDFGGTAAASVAARRSGASAFLGHDDIVRHGPSDNRVDVVLMGDGYELAHMKAFDKIANDIPPLFERQDVFREYYAYFNFIRASVVSAESGVDGFGREYDTALGAQTIGTIQGHVAVQRTRVHEMLREMPDHDALAIAVIRQGALGTGGEGIATVGGTDSRILIHEFGHAFADLYDEYTTANYEPRIARPIRPELRAVNVSGSSDPKSAPWAHWIAARHPTVGMYEGAAGQVQGAWKPTSGDCVMDDDEFFCPVCREAIVLRIYSLVDPIDACDPPTHPYASEDVLVLTDKPVEIEVRVLRPTTHNLEVRWWILPPERLPRTSEAGFEEIDDSSRRYFDRRERGRLPRIVDRPEFTSRNNPSGVHKLRILRSETKPGRYRVVCRVRDTTRLRDEEWPWVLADEHGVLESERAWWLYVE